MSSLTHKLTRAIEDYKANASTMSPNQRRRAEQAIDKMTTTVLRRIRNVHHHINVSTGMVTQHHTPAVPGCLPCDGRALPITHPLYRVIGLRFTPRRLPRFERKLPHWVWRIKPLAWLVTRPNPIIKAGQFNIPKMEVRP